MIMTLSISDKCNICVQILSVLSHNVNFWLYRQRWWSNPGPEKSGDEISENIIRWHLVQDLNTIWVRVNDWELLFKEKTTYVILHNEMHFLYSGNIKRNKNWFVWQKINQALFFFWIIAPYLNIFCQHSVACLWCYFARSLIVFVYHLSCRFVTRIFHQRFTEIT